MILLAILLPPVPFYLRGKIIAGTICLILYIVSCITAIAFGFGVVLYLILAIWSVISHNNAKNDKKMKKMEERIISSQQTKSEQ